MAQSFLSLTAFQTREEIRPGGRDGRPCRVLFVVTTGIAQQRMHSGIAIHRQVEPAMAGGRVEKHALAVANRALRWSPGRVGMGAELLPT